VRECAERVASSEFKPSVSGTERSYFGLNLRDQGVSYLGVFLHYPWARQSWRSFFGVYGHMEFLGPAPLFLAMTMAALLLCGGVLMANLVKSDPFERITTLVFVVLFAVTIFISSYHSWVNDFQPQGRYLFPVLPMLSLTLASAYNRNERLSYAVVFMFSVSCYSFMVVGLYRWL